MRLRADTIAHTTSGRGQELPIKVPKVSYFIFIISPRCWQNLGATHIPQSGRHTSHSRGVTHPGELCDVPRVYQDLELMKPQDEVFPEQGDRATVIAGVSMVGPGGIRRAVVAYAAGLPAPSR